MSLPLLLRHLGPKNPKTGEPNTKQPLHAGEGIRILVQLPSQRNQRPLETNPRTVDTVVVGPGQKQHA